LWSTREKEGDQYIMPYLSGSGIPMKGSSTFDGSYEQRGIEGSNVKGYPGTNLLLAKRSVEGSASKVSPVADSPKTSHGAPKGSRAKGFPDVHIFTVVPCFLATKVLEA
jgi:hypothetical protein